MSINSVLPEDVLNLALQEAIIVQGNLSNRTVCQKWCKLIEQQTIRSIVRRWGEEIDQFPETFGLRKSVKEFSSRWATVSLSDFKKFTLSVKRMVGPKAMVQKSLLASVADFRSLTAIKEGTNLHFIWSEIVKKRPQLPSAKTAEEIHGQFIENRKDGFDLKSLTITARMTSIPPEMTCLLKLESFHISNSQLPTVPLELLELPKLDFIAIRENPPFIADEKVLNSRLPNLCPMLMNFKQECQYPQPISPLGIFYQAILKRPEMNEISSEIKTAFDKLDKEDKNLVYEMVFKCADPKTNDPKWGEKNVFDSLHLLYKATCKMIVLKQERLTDGIANKTYGYVYKLAGSPTTTDPNWGKNNAIGNLTLLCDAMYKASRESVE